MSGLHCIITTIQAPTAAVRLLAKKLEGSHSPLLIVGDSKGPASYPLAGARFLGLADQMQTSFRLAQELPTGHYARKNIGYLAAIADGAECIYETDDDNAPLDSWSMRSETVSARAVVGEGWINAYRCFTDEHIWPRGLPLDALGAPAGNGVKMQVQAHEVRAPIQQGLANGSPDVDAIWRLVLDRNFEFSPGDSVVLGKGAWCPFNSQSTWWWPDAFPLLYLPSHCSFRMTDIWRSFIAQRCLWELGHGLVFHAAEVVQDRNEHDLMRDFTQEIPGYLRNREFVDLLMALELSAGVDSVGDNLSRCYAALAQRDFFPQAELHLLESWLADLGAVREHG